MTPIISVTGSWCLYLRGRLLAMLSLTHQISRHGDFGERVLPELFHPHKQLDILQAFKVLRM